MVQQAIGYLGDERMIDMRKVKENESVVIFKIGDKFEICDYIVWGRIFLFM